MSTKKRQDYFDVKKEIYFSIFIIFLDSVEVISYSIKIWLSILFCTKYKEMICSL